MDKIFFKNIIIGVLIVIVVFLVFSWFKTPKITDLFVGNPAFTFYDSGDMVSVGGAWLPPIINSENRSPIGVLLTNTSIVCDKATRSCRESRAVINRLIDNLGLQAWTFEYPIQEWGDQFIVASIDSSIRTDELRINRRQKSATLIQTERNTNSAASQPFVWELVGTDSAIKRFKELNK